MTGLDTSAKAGIAILLLYAALRRFLCKLLSGMSSNRRWCFHWIALFGEVGGTAKMRSEGRPGEPCKCVVST